jgi:hypothetical protein
VISRADLGFQTGKTSKLELYAVTAVTAVTGALSCYKLEEVPNWKKINLDKYILICYHLNMITIQNKEVLKYLRDNDLFDYLDESNTDLELRIPDIEGHVSNLLQRGSNITNTEREFMRYGLLFEIKACGELEGFKTYNPMGDLYPKYWLQYTLELLSAKEKGDSTFEVGLKYPLFDNWHKLMSDFGFAKESRTLGKYKVFTSEKCIMGGDETYIGLIFPDAETGYLFLRACLEHDKNYVKDVSLFYNGFSNFNRKFMEESEAELVSPATPKTHIYAAYLTGINSTATARVLYGADTLEEAEHIATDTLMRQPKYQGYRLDYFEHFAIVADLTENNKFLEF